MAGDWLKWTKGLAKKPEVVRMAARLKLSRWDVAGRLMEVWEWADENVLPDTSRTESDASVEMGDEAKDLIDSIVGVRGFAGEMARVGWLSIRNSRLSFPNFTRHNTDPAKQRALAASRKQKQRSKSADGVSRKEREKSHAKSVTREEKRNKEPPKPPKGGAGFLKKISKADLQDPEKVRAWIERNIPPPVSEDTRLKILACAIRARAEGDTPPVFFLHLVGSGLGGEWKVSEDDLQAASRWGRDGGPSSLGEIFG